MTSDPLIANTGFDKAKGMDLLRSGDADAIAYGSLYIANPDLVARFKADAPLSKPYPPAFCGSGPKSYTDSPAVSAKDKAA
jgi:N-ethylmaleimide reductase